MRCMLFGVVGAVFLLGCDSVAAEGPPGKDGRDGRDGADGARGPTGAAGVVDELVLVTAKETVLPNDTGAAVAICQSGQVISGGCQWGRGSPPPTDVYQVSTQPVLDGEGVPFAWACEGYVVPFPGLNDSGSEVTAFALCTAPEDE